MSGTGDWVYVVDDDPFARDGVADVIRSAGMMARTFASGEEFLAAPRSEMPSCLVLDVHLPGLSGLEVQQELAKSGVQIPIIFLTGHGDIPMTVRAVKAGAVDFLTKPFDDEDLLNAIRQCIHRHVKENVRGKASFGPIVGDSSLFKDGLDLGHDESPLDHNIGKMVGEEPSFQALLRSIEIVAPTDAVVLILGETGTGKELVARAIHELSSRGKSSFVKVNCAAIPDSLLESELFGHEKGSFTGAVAQKIGRFELAHQGTLFLDEIGEMPLELQPKLLRAIQDQEFERIGSNRTIRTNVRFVAATNRDLKAMVDENRFRGDLYYRLHVFPLNVPPLRERREDIPLLTRYFVQKHAQRMGRKIESIPRQALETLTNYDWPGNIRELQNVIERSVILSNGPELSVAMPDSDSKSAPVAPEGGASNDRLSVERERILQALKEAKGQVGGPDGAAARLGLKRTTLQARMRKYNIAREYQ